MKIKILEKPRKERQFTSDKGQCRPTVLGRIFSRTSEGGCWVADEREIFLLFYFIKSSISEFLAFYKYCYRMNEPIN